MKEHMKSIELTYPMNASQERYYKMPRIYRDSTAFYFDSFVLTDHVRSQLEMKARIESLKQRHPALSCAPFLSDDKRGMLRFALQANSYGGYEVSDELPDIPFTYTDISYMGGSETENKPSKEQEAYMEEAYRVQCEIRKLTETQLSIHYFLLREDLAKIVIMSTHVMLDGWSMTLLIKELTSDDEPVGQDKYFMCADKTAHYDKTDNDYDIQYWKKRLHEADKGSFPWENAYNGPLKMLELSINGEKYEKLCEYSRKEEVSKVSLLQYAYGRAMLSLNGKDSVVFDQLISGRAVLPEGSEDVIGVFFNVLPCVLYKGENNKQFYEHCIEDRLHGRSAAEKIWEAVFGRKIYLPMNKGITSEIFPFNMSDNVIEIHSTLERNPGKIMVPEKDGIRIYFCYRDNPAWNDKTEYLVKETENYIYSVINV